LAIPASTISHQGVALRRLRLLGVVLALSNLLLGGVSVYLLRQVDADYSRLIDDSVPLINEIRLMGKDGGNVFRSVIAGLVTSDPRKCAAAVARARTSLELEHAMRQKVQAAKIFSDRPAIAADLRSAGDAFELTVTALLPRVTPENTADAEKESIEKLQWVIDRFATAVQTASEYVEARTKAANDDYTASVRHRTFVVLGLAGWPLLVAGVFLVLTLVVVVFMLVVFRAADVGDGP